MKGWKEGLAKATFLFFLSILFLMENCFLLALVTVTKGP